MNRVEVFAQSDTHSELWASFEHESIYIACLPELVLRSVL